MHDVYGGGQDSGGKVNPWNYVGLMTHDMIMDLLSMGVVLNAKTDQVNASSLDLTLDDKILIEGPGYPDIILRDRNPLRTEAKVIRERGFWLGPGMFILAASREVFNLPDWISAEYRLKSSMARVGLEHLTAGWIDAGFNNSVLTLELKNMTQRHTIFLQPGDRIGQVMFYAHKEVDPAFSYRTKGSYNNQMKVSGALKEKKP